MTRKNKDWMNVKQPCQFLDLSSNLCSIYEVRPTDCAGFPHLVRKKMVDYIHVHQQNISTVLPLIKWWKDDGKTGLKTTPANSSNKKAATRTSC